MGERESEREIYGPRCCDEDHFDTPVTTTAGRERGLNRLCNVNNFLRPTVQPILLEPPSNRTTWVIRRLNSTFRNKLTVDDLQLSITISHHIRTLIRHPNRFEECIRQSWVDYGLGAHTGRHHVLWAHSAVSQRPGRMFRRWIFFTPHTVVCFMPSGELRSCAAGHIRLASVMESTPSIQ